MESYELHKIAVSTQKLACEQQMANELKVLELRFMMSTGPIKSVDSDSIYAVQKQYKECMKGL